MTALRYAFLAALVFTASACDSGDDEVRRAFITQISIIDAPTFRDNGDPWDRFLGIETGPDIFLEVEGSNGTILLNTRDIVYEDGSRGVAEDADALSFPVTFPVPNIPEAEFDDLNRILRVELRDSDPDGSESMLFTDQFTFDEFAPTNAGTRSNIRIESADRTALVQITVDWEN